MQKACIQLSLSGTPVNFKKMRGKFMEISQKMGIDISFHVDNIYTKNRKLVEAMAECMAQLDQGMS